MLFYRNFILDCRISGPIKYSWISCDNQLLHLDIVGMSVFKTNSQKFCMSFTKNEVPLFREIEEQLMKETGKNRGGIYKEGLKHYYNSRQQAKLQMVWEEIMASEQMSQDVYNKLRDIARVSHMQPRKMLEQIVLGTYQEFVDAKKLKEKWWQVTFISS